MRGRIVLFLVLAVVTALVGVYLGRSTTTPTAVGEPATTTPLDSSVGPPQRRDSGSGPSRSPTPPKSSPQKAPPPKASPPKACSPQAATQPAAYTTPSGQQPQTEPASQPQPSTDPVRFGKVTTTPSDKKTIETDLTEDGRAFTLGFSDREVQVAPGSTHCDATRSFAMTLPLTDGAEGDTLWIHVLGYAFTDEHATARLILRLNGQVRVTDFTAGSDKEFQQTLQVPAIPATTYRLSGVIEVHQDPDTGGTAILNVSSVETEIS